MAEQGLFDFLNRATMNPLFMGGLGLLSGGGGQGAMQGMQQGLMAQRQMTQDQELAQRKAAFQQAVQNGLFKDMPGGMGALAPLMTPEQAIGLAGDFGKAKYGSDLNISERRQILPLEEAMKQRMLAAQGSQELRNTQALTAWRAQNDPMYQAQLRQLAQKPEGKTMEVNGKIVHIPPDGRSAIPIYDAGPNFDKLPEFSAKSAAFASRMTDAEANLRNVLAQRSADGVSPTFDPTSAKTAIINATPEGLANYQFRSPQHQQYMQSAEQWIRAFLRKESGAAIGKDEFARDFKVYFPQAGDSPEVMAQKEQARLDAMRGFAAETRGFFEHASPQQAARLKEWTTPPQKMQSDLGPKQQTSPRSAPPKAGQSYTYNGGSWRFRGGDPANPASWEQIR